MRWQELLKERERGKEAFWPFRVRRAPGASWHVSLMEPLGGQKHEKRTSPTSEVRRPSDAEVIIALSRKDTAHTKERRKTSFEKKKKNPSGGKDHMWQVLPGTGQECADLVPSCLPVFLSEASHLTDEKGSRDQRRLRNRPLSGKCKLIKQALRERGAHFVLQNSPQRLPSLSAGRARTFHPFARLSAYLPAQAWWPAVGSPPAK